MPRTRWRIFLGARGARASSRRYRSRSVRRIGKVERIIVAVETTLVECPASPVSLQLVVMPAGPFAYVVEIATARHNGDDRARVFAPEGGIVVALADGAGGTGNGARAAQAIVDAAGALCLTPDWSALLADLDQDCTRLGHGQSTAVLLSISASGISGASVGDSGAWVITGADVVDLTAGQHRKPLVGEGCLPFRVTAPPLGGGTLLVASDGLLRYAKQTDIARIANGPDLRASARELVDHVRLPNGSLQDDVAIVLCRQFA